MRGPWQVQGRADVVMVTTDKTQSVTEQCWLNWISAADTAYELSAAMHSGLTRRDRQAYVTSPDTRWRIKKLARGCVGGGGRSLLNGSLADKETIKTSDVFVAACCRGWVKVKGLKQDPNAGNSRVAKWYLFTISKKTSHKRKCWKRKRKGKKEKQ